MQDFKSYTYDNKRSARSLFKRIILAGFALGIIAFFVLILLQPSNKRSAMPEPEATPETTEPGRVTLPLRLPGKSQEEGHLPQKPAAKGLAEVMLAEAGKDTDPPPVQSQTVQVTPTEPEIHWISHEIMRGESLSSIFKQFGLSANLLHRIVHSSKQAKTLTRIQPGETLRIALDDEKKFRSLILEHSKGRSLHITATEDGFSAKNETKKVELLTAKDTIASQNQAPLIHPEPTSPEFHWSSHEIASGDSLSNIFKQFGLSANLLYRIVHSSKQAKTLTQLQPGETLHIALNDEEKFKSLKLEHDKIHSLHITATDNGGFSVKDEIKQVELRTAHVQASIDNSLYLSAKEAGLPDALIMELANIFGWDIDFALEIRGGDSFTVIYQEEYLEGEKYQNGPILAAEFINQGRSYRAVRYLDNTGHADYYTPEGRSMRKAFLRAPVDFRRISSRFTKERWHPVLGKKRPHRGVDYAAKTGTPIKAAGDGKIVHRGKKGGYGRTVIIHGQSYTTLYAHLSKYNKKAKLGKKVTQGQVIGYVGKSGLATGPHLHYEFRLNGVHRNPLTVKLPAAQPIAKQYLTDFTLKTQPLIAQLDTLNRILIADAR